MLIIVLGHAGGSDVYRLGWLRFTRGAAGQSSNRIRSLTQFFRQRTDAGSRIRQMHSCATR